MEGFPMRRGKSNASESISRVASGIALPLLCLVLFARLSEAAKILALIPVPSYSHQVAYRSLWKALSERGHELVVLTTDPMRDPNLVNITEIDTHKTYDYLKDLDFASLRQTSTYRSLMENYVWNLGYKLSEYAFNHPEMKRLYAPGSGAKFDLVIAEDIMTASCYILAHRFNAPLIGASSMGLINYKYFLYGAPVLPSNPSAMEMERDTGLHLPFLKRLNNFVAQWKYVYNMYNTYMPSHQRIAEKYFGNDIPDLVDVEKNMSLVLTYLQATTSFVRPTVPKVVSFGGIHISKELAPLPEDLKAFVDSATNGFVYLSLGTNVNTAFFPEEKKRIFLDVLSNLPCKVVWKYNGRLPRKYDNIFVSSWFSQQSVLAHPNIKVFVYQGGLQSTQEAVHFAVPLVGIPVFADQDYQINKMVSVGVARRLEFTELERKDMDEAIRDVLTNKSYKERMVELHNVTMDMQTNVLDNVVWWIEFVIRHKGAPHLQCSLSHEPWYQKFDTDIIAFLSIVAFVAICGILVAIYKSLAAVLVTFKTSLRVKRKLN